MDFLSLGVWPLGTDQEVVLTMQDLYGLALHSGVLLDYHSMLAGTSMLARRLTTILPAVTLAGTIETTRLHSVAGCTGGRTAWPSRAPFAPPTRRSRTWG
jgi:hypothetical protein